VIIKLYMGRCLESFVEPCLALWFVEAARQSWKDLRPTVVLVPHQVYANRVRAHLAAREIPTLNVRFWTLPEMRRHLASAAGVSPALEDREDRLLILRAAALAVGKADAANQASAAVAAAPASLLEATELLEEGGWNRDQVTAPSLGPILAARDALLARTGRSGPASWAFSLPADRVRGSLAQILIAGFDAGHFGEWATLKLAAEAADEALVLLHTPRQKAEGLDLAWLASWEKFGPITAVGEDDPAGSPALAAAFDDLPLPSGAAPETDRVALALAATIMEEADQAAAAAAQALGAGARSVGLVVPQSGYLAREIARRLDHLGLPYYDGLAPTADDTRTAGFLRKFLALFEEQTVPRLLDLLAEPEVQPDGLKTGRMRSVIEHAIQAFLFTDIGLCSALLAEDEPPTARLIRELVAPAEATLGAFLAGLARAAGELGAEAAARQIRRLAAEKPDFQEIAIDRRGLRQWAEPYLLALEKRRSPLGTNPYARIQLIRPEHANGLSWDLLCFTGQNEGVWPPPVRACPYLGDDALRELNEQVFHLNGRALEAGERDEPTGVRDGRALCLSPSLRHILVLRDFANALELSGRVVLSAARRDASQAGAGLYPGQLFTRLQQLLQRGDDEVRGARCQLPEKFRRMPTNTDGLEEMLHAWHERRNPAAAFGEYEFCLKSPPDWAVAVPSSGWEGAFGNPAAVFLRTFLGVTQPRNIEEEMPWKMVAGIWVHAWISRTVGQAPKPLAEIGGWAEQIETEAGRHRERIARVLAGAGRGLPAWWTSLFEQARAMGRKFAASLESARGYVYAQGEVVIPAVDITLPSGARLPVFGRADLVLSDRLPAAADDYTDCRLAILDFKTGKAVRPLRADALRRGEGVQLPLYGLSLAALGATETELALIRPGDPVETQLTLAEVRRESAIFELFAWMLGTGTFGRLEPMRPEFGEGPGFPIACLETGTNLKRKMQATMQNAPLPSP
jgi:hypothetical protein